MLMHGGINTMWFDELKMQIFMLFWDVTTATTTIATTHHHCHHRHQIRYEIGFNVLTSMVFA